jgi:hypothetical protein
MAALELIDAGIKAADYFFEVLGRGLDEIGEATTRIRSDDDGNFMTDTAEYLSKLAMLSPQEIKDKRRKILREIQRGYDKLEKANKYARRR